GLKQGENPALKVFLTSRPYNVIEQHLEETPKETIDLEEESDAVCVDIELVVRTKVVKIARRWKLPDAVRDNFINRLVRNADRTFLWVMLVLEEIHIAEEKEQFHGLQKEFNQLMLSIPSTLDGLYEKILQKSSDPGTARRILGIVLAASRPLTIDQLNIALAMRRGLDSLESMERFPNLERSIKSICGLFVRVIKGRTYLVHQTAKEFLVGSDFQTSGHKQRWRRSVDPVKANRDLTEICLLYLSLVRDKLIKVFVSDTGYDNDKDGYGDDNESSFDYNPYFSMGREKLKAVTMRFKFMEYATNNWVDHFLKAKIIQNDPVLQVAIDVCNHVSRTAPTWFHVHCASTHHSLGEFTNPDDCTALIVAAHFGIDVVVLRLLNEGHGVDEKNLSGQTALYIAAMRGHHTTVKLLLDKGAAIDARDENSDSAIDLAILTGEGSIVRELLDRGATIIPLKKLDESSEASVPDLQSWIGTSILNGVWRGVRTHGFNDRGGVDSYEMAFQLSSWTAGEFQRSFIKPQRQDFWLEIFRETRYEQTQHGWVLGFAQ
ncbi:MAG: hypothetical protein Q9187_008472, partial [Circinaria calcarea]